MTKDMGDGVREYGTFTHREEDGGREVFIIVGSKHVGLLNMAIIYGQGVSVDDIEDAHEHPTRGIRGKASVPICIDVSDAKKIIAALKAFVEESETPPARITDRNMS